MIYQILRESEVKIMRIKTKYIRISVFEDSHKNDEVIIQKELLVS